LQVSHVGEEFLQRIMEKLVEAVTEELNRYRYLDKIPEKQKTVSRNKN
jgi:hypothetical protein